MQTCDTDGVLHKQELISWRAKGTERQATSPEGLLFPHALPSSIVFLSQSQTRACKNAALFLEHRLMTLVSELPCVPHSPSLVISRLASLQFRDSSPVDWVSSSVPFRCDSSPFPASFFPLDGMVVRGLSLPCLPSTSLQPVSLGLGDSSTKPWPRPLEPCGISAIPPGHA